MTTIMMMKMMMSHGIIKDNPSYYSIGYSEIGPSHIANHKPNQDFFLIRQKSLYKVLVVADGVGSHEYSQYGSKAVCKSVVKTFARVAKGKVADEDILQSIYDGYKKRLPKKASGKAGTTCLFCSIIGDKMYLGQAGDGSCSVKIDQKFKRGKRKKSDEFLNQVVAIKDTREYNDWLYNVIDISNVQSIDIMLMTDGLSEDIIPSKASDFMDYVFDKVESQSSRVGALKSIVSDWEDTGSLDDKTIAIARWRRKINE